MTSTSSTAAAQTSQSKTDIDPGGTFVCTGCKIEENFHYLGDRPPFCRGLLLSEVSYVARDPFSPPGQRSFLLLGSDCSLCKNPVCQDSACSVFYTKRFCIPCAQDNINCFPQQVQAKMKVQKQ